MFPFSWLLLFSSFWFAQSALDYFQTLFSGPHLSKIQVIDPYEGKEASLLWEEMNQARIAQVKELIATLQVLLEKFQEERKKLNPYHYLEASEDNSHFNVNLLGFAQSPLNYLHLLLGCEFLRRPLLSHSICDFI